MLETNTTDKPKQCDLCQDGDGEDDWDWNPETNRHKTCEEWVYRLEDDGGPVR